MKTLITRTTKGYSIVIVDDNGNETVTELSTYKGEPYTLVLPENPSNRKYFNSKKVDAAGGTIELTYKETIKLGPKAAQKPLEDYLNEEDRYRYEELMAIARANREAAIKQAQAAKSDPVAKLQAQIAREQAKLKKLMALAALEEESDEDYDPDEELGDLDE